MANDGMHRVIKVGSSLGVVLPVAVCRTLGIARGDLVSFGVFEENTVVIRKVTPEQLKQLAPKTILYGK